MAQAKNDKTNDSKAAKDEAAKGIGARDNTGTKTATSGAKRVGPGAAEKQTGVGVDNTTNLTPNGAPGAAGSPVVNSAGPVMEQGPGAPGFITPAVGGIEGASFSAGGTPVTPVVGSVVPVIQDDDVPAGQSPVEYGEVPTDTDPKKTQNHSDRTKEVNNKKHK